MKRCASRRTASLLVGLFLLPLVLGAGTDYLLQNDIVLDLQGNTIAADGSITIGSKGLVLRRAGGVITRGTGQAVTVIADVEDIPLPATAGDVLTLAMVNVNGSDYGTSLDVNADGTYSTDWTHGGGGYRKVSTTQVTSGTHRFGLVYKNGWGERSYLDGEDLTAFASACSGEGYLGYVRFGEYSGGTCVATGLKIKRFAVINAQLTAAEIAAWDLTTRASAYARFATDFADRIVTYTAASGTKNWCTDVTVSRFNPQLGVRLPVDYSCNMNTTYTNLPGSTVEAAFWTCLCTGANKAYTVPGLVVRFPACPDEQGFSSSGAFTPFNLGGLIVEAGASPAGHPVTLFDLATEARTTALGDPRGTPLTECHFVLNDDFTLARKGSCSIYGTVNFDIAEGKCFDCTTTNPTMQVYLGGAVPVLKMNGLGTFKVRTLNADGGTLDYSGQALARATPYLDGNLRVTANTKFIFPAGFEAGASYTLCSGTVTSPATSWNAFVTVGDVKKYVTLTLDGNRISYADVTAVTDGQIYPTAQAAFDAATASSTVSVYRASAVALARATSVRRFEAFADVAFGGTGPLTLGNTVYVDSAARVTVKPPTVLAAVVGKIGAGNIRFDGAFSAGGATGCKFVVLDGSADFDGAISDVMVYNRGLTADESSWPVITLWTNCTVDVASALVSPALADTGVATYGKLIQNGATISGVKDSVMLTNPRGGEARYILNSGTINLPSSIFHLQYASDPSSWGRITFVQNGGTVTVSRLNICRVVLYAARDEFYRYVLNGGTLNAMMTGVVGANWDAAHAAEKLRFELNGGTVGLGNELQLHDTGCIYPVLGGTVTFTNNAGTATRLPDALYGHGNLIFAGAGTFDFAAATNVVTDTVTVSGGAVTLPANCFGETSVVTIAPGARLGLPFDGTRTIRTLNLRNSPAPRGRAYGCNGARPGSFVATAPAGALVPTEGPDPQGFCLIVR